jgi:hypothetical protein
MEDSMHDRLDRFSRKGILDDFTLKKEQALIANGKADAFIMDECMDECDPVMAYEETLNALETHTFRNNKPAIPYFSDVL